MPTAPSRAAADPAARYHRAQLRLSLIGLALSAGYLVGLVATGAAAALARSAATLTSSPPLQLAVALAVLGGAYRLATWPLAWLSGFWLPRRYGLLHQPLARWLWDGLKAAALGGTLGLAAVEVLYALLRATPWWWLWSALVLLGGSALLTLVTPVWLVPLFYALTPLPDGELRARLVRLAEGLGVPVLGVWVADQSRRSRTANAAVTGLGRTRRIILFDTLADRFTPDEVESVLAHELAHHLHADIWRGLAVQTAITLATLWVCDRALRAATGRLGLAGPADLAGLPVLGLVVMAVGLAALPLVNGWSRRVERQADAFALRATGNPEAFISAMQRLGALNLAEERPHPVKEFFLYSHPPIAKRVAHARAFLTARS